MNEDATRGCLESHDTIIDVKNQNKFSGFSDEFRWPMLAGHWS